MLWKITPLIFIFFLIAPGSYGQVCTNLGQNPGTAFPVCGTSTFTQQTVPACGGRSIPVPGCENDNAAYGDLNPFWYKFTCFSGGTLGLTITPLTATDDYDWQLFDITGRNATDVYSDRSLYVASNWSAHPGATGTATNASSFTNCAGFDYPNTSKMPTLIEGHQYLLLVSHYTITNQSGYKLSFDGGTANITDPKVPHLSHATAYCDGRNIIVKLNKKMRCNTLAADGSDFSVSYAGATITKAVATACLTGFDMDSVTIALNNALPIGDYSLTIKKGSDDNTLLDNCDRGIEEGESVPFSVLPVQPTPMDSLTTPGCAPNMLQLVFKKPIRCNSIAADGSDFIINGLPAIGIASASGECNDNGVSNVIHVKLATPVFHKGTYTITLKKGSDGNTIIDECGEETPGAAALSFTTTDTVSAAFDYSILYGCDSDTIIFSHSGANQANAWNWIFDDNTSGTGQHFQKTYSVFGQKTATLIVSNGVCYDTAFADIMLDNELKADFEAPEFICPRDSTIYKDLSTGNILQWNWTFGNGTNSILKSPPAQSYSVPLTDQEYNIRLVVTNNHGCTDTAVKKVKLISSCYIDIPTAFTPNGDNLNDYLYPLNAYKADELTFSVYNLYGQKVFETTDRIKKWDGTLNGKMQGSGTYVWTLQYVHTDTRRVFHLKGTTTLIR